MNDDELRRALRTLERVQPPEGVADALFERLLDELAEERVSRPAPLPRRRRLRWLQGRPVIAFGVALALLIGAAVVVLVPRPRTALAVLQEARQRFEDLPPYHATTVVRANDDASDPDFETTWETEDWHASVRRWRTLFTSGDLSFTGGPGSYRVFDGTLVGDFHAEANVFTVMPFEDLDQEFEQASPSFFFNPSLQYWSTGEEGVAGKPTDQFFEEDCTATPGRFIGRAATAIHCEAKPSDLEVWVDDETGMLLRIQWFDVIREIRTIEFRPEFPAGIFEVVPPEGAKKRWGGKGPAPPDYETAVGDEVAARYQVAQPPLGGLPVLEATPKGVWVSSPNRAENEPYRTSLVRVDPRSGKVVATLDAPLYDFVNSAAEVGDSLWVYLSERPRGDETHNRTARC